MWLITSGQNELPKNQPRPRQRLTTNYSGPILLAAVYCVIFTQTVSCRGSQCSEDLFCSLHSPFFYETIQKMWLWTPTWPWWRAGPGRAVRSRRRCWTWASPLAPSSWVQPLCLWASWWTDLGHAHWGSLAGVTDSLLLFAFYQNTSADFNLLNKSPIGTTVNVLWHPVSFSAHVSQLPVPWWLPLLMTLQVR